MENQRVERMAASDRSRVVLDFDASEAGLSRFAQDLLAQAQKHTLKDSDGRMVYELPDKTRKSVKTSMPIFDGSVVLKGVSLGDSEKKMGQISFQLRHEKDESVLSDLDGMSFTVSRKVLGLDVDRRADLKAIIIPDNPGEPLTMELSNPIRLKVVRRALNLTDETIKYRLAR